MQTINSAYQAYLSSGGTALPSYYFGSSNIPASAIFSQVAGISQTENGPIGPFLTDWPEASWAGTIPVNMTGGEVKYMQPVFNFTSSTGEVMFYLFPDNSIDIVPHGGGWGSFGSNSWGSGYGSGWGSIISDYQYDWGSGYGSGYGSGWGSGSGSGWSIASNLADADYSAEAIQQDLAQIQALRWGSGSGFGSGWGINNNYADLLSKMAYAMDTVSPDLAEIISTAMWDLALDYDNGTWVAAEPVFEWTESSGLPDPALLLPGYRNLSDPVAQANYFAGLDQYAQASLFTSLSPAERAVAANSYFSALKDMTTNGASAQQLWAAELQAQADIRTMLANLPDGFAGIALNNLEGHGVNAVLSYHERIEGSKPLKNLNLSGLNLWGLNLMGKDVQGVDFSGTGTVITTAQLNSVGYPGLLYANLSGLNLIGLKPISNSSPGFTGVNFVGATLDVSILKDTRIDGADLSNHNLSGLNFTRGTIISGANLSNTGVTAAQIASASGNTWASQEFLLDDPGYFSMNADFTNVYTGTPLNLSGTGITRETLRQAFEAAGRRVSDKTLDSIIY